MLLIRHSYGSGQWMPPGGGVGRGEPPLAAALRELAEEVALELHDPVEVAQVEEQLHGAGNTVHVIAGRAGGTVRIDGREVIEAGFFAPTGLPRAMPAQLHRELGGWIAAFHAGRRTGELAP